MQFKGPGLSQSEDGGSADTFLPPAPSACGWLTEYPAGSRGGGCFQQPCLHSAVLSAQTFPQAQVKKSTRKPAALTPSSLALLWGILQPVFMPPKPRRLIEVRGHDQPQMESSDFLTSELLLFLCF